MSQKPSRKNKANRIVRTNPKVGMAAVVVASLGFILAVWCLAKGQTNFAFGFWVITWFITNQVSADEAVRVLSKLTGKLTKKLEEATEPELPYDEKPSDNVE